MLSVLRPLWAQKERKDGCDVCRGFGLGAVILMHSNRGHVSVFMLISPLTGISKGSNTCCTLALDGLMLGKVSYN